MSEIVKDLMYTSAEWTSDEAANKALTDGMEEVTKVTLEKCYCQHGVVRLDRETDVIDGAYHDLRIVSGQSIGSPVVQVGIMGT